MKTFTSIFFVLFCLQSMAQNVSMDQGIDAFFMEDGFFDNIANAKSTPNEVLFLDLSLQSPKLKEIPAEVFGFKNLKYLELGFNQMAAIDDKILALTSLEVLGLDENKYLKSISIKIGELTQLKKILVHATGMSTEQLKKLEASLPQGCKLVR